MLQPTPGGFNAAAPGPCQNDRVKRSRTGSRGAASVPARASALALVLALVFTAGIGCSAPSETGGGDEATPSAGVAGVAHGGTTIPAPDAALSDAKARLEAALRPLAAADAKPGTERIRTALTDAGFPADSGEVTASKTPTGLDTDAVEVAVQVDRNCIIAQLRNGTVTASVLPVLADGRCFVGTPG